MLECHSCIRQCFRALISVHCPVRAIHSNVRGKVKSTFKTRRAAWEQGGRTRPPNATESRDDALKPSRDNWKDSDMAREQNKRLTAALRSDPQERERQEKALVGQELRFLRDPLKLADHVKYVLQHDRLDKALALVRLSSRSQSNIVSWNHIMDWQMSQGKTKSAIDTFNEMKKRGQKPDNFTFTVLLRGLADNAHHPGSLGRALSLYHSMNMPHANVAPNIIHTNAILKVCARANDMDSLWDIASRMPERGPQSANNWTYTTIINNIRMNAIIAAPDREAAESMARRREAAIVDGRRLWSVVIKKWRAGDLVVDEELVCAMGRLLLVGSRPRDWDDVLSLVQQAMDIPRLVPRLGTAARLDAPVPRIRAPYTPADMKNDATDIGDPFGDPKPGSEFDSHDSKDQVMGRDTTIAKGKPHVYAVPGNSTLSLVTEACLKMVAEKAAQDYWTLLTTSHRVKPDLDNIHMLLRVLRQSRASAEVVRIVREEMPALGLQPLKKTFHIAMSACARDRHNRVAFTHAGQLLDRMQTVLPEPDVRALLLFVEAGANSSERAVLVRVLERLEPGAVNIRRLLDYGSEATKQERGLVEAKDVEDAKLLVRKMIGLYDRLVATAGEEPKVEKALVETWVMRRAKLAGYIRRAMRKPEDLAAIRAEEKSRARLE